jgi:hypothetical protein
VFGLLGIGIVCSAAPWCTHRAPSTAPRSAAASR